MGLTRLPTLKRVLGFEGLRRSRSARERAISSSACREDLLRAGEGVGLRGCCERLERFLIKWGSGEGRGWERVRCSKAERVESRESSDELPSSLSISAEELGRLREEEEEEELGRAG